MSALISQILLRLLAFVKYLVICVGILYLASPFITPYFGFSGLFFLEPEIGAYNLTYFPAQILSILSNFFQRTDVMEYLLLFLEVEMLYWSAVFIRRIFITRFSDVD